MLAEIVPTWFSDKFKLVAMTPVGAATLAAGRGFLRNQVSRLPAKGGDDG